MTAFVMLLPVLVAILVSSIDLWTIVASTTRCQNVANAGVRHIEALAEERSALQGTKAHTEAPSLSVTSEDVKAAALANGHTDGAGSVENVTVVAQAWDAGTSSYDVTTWVGGEPTSLPRTVRLSAVRVTASQAIPFISPLTSFVMGDGGVTVSRTATGQVPLEVILT